MPNNSYADEKSLLTSLFFSKLSCIKYLAVSIPDILLFSILGSSIALILCNNLLKAQTEISN